jgi:hypothetical protein
MLNVLNVTVMYLVADYVAIVTITECLGFIPVCVMYSGLRLYLTPHSLGRDRTTILGRRVIRHSPFPPHLLIVPAGNNGCSDSAKSMFLISGLEVEPEKARLCPDRMLG